MSGLIQRTLPPCEQCLKDADVPKSDITDVVLVGGMTRMPRVQEVVEKFFGKQPGKSVNPDDDDERLSKHPSHQLNHPVFHPNQACG